MDFPSLAKHLTREAAERIEGLGHLEPSALAARLTLLGLLLAPIGLVDLRAAVLILAGGGLLAPRLAEWSPFWIVLTALAALRVALDWPLSDNHGYLLVAWCLALALAFASRVPTETAAEAARRLIGFTFALAIIQKAFLSPDYLDGTFFRWTLAEDHRFEILGRVLGRDADALTATRAFLHADPAMPVPEGAAFVEPVALRVAATVLTWSTLAIEGFLALVFLAPTLSGGGRWRDASLIVFCLGTYLVAPVVGFGWMLIAMGVAQSRGARARWVYLGVFALLVFYREVLKVL